MGFNDHLLAGKHAVVTAGASGIGAAIAAALKEAGAKVAVCDIDPGAVANAEDNGSVDIAAVADVSDFDQVQAFMDKVAAEFGQLDILVNNAGIAGPTGPVETLDPDGWDQTVRVGLGGAFNCSKAVIPHIKQQGNGSIINIASSAALFGFPGRAPYAAAKWGLIGFTKTLSMELGPDQITVNAICPGSVEGDRINRVMAAEAVDRNISIEEVKASYTKQTSMKCFVTKEDVANMVVYLCSPMGAKVSGQVMAVDGHTEGLTQF